LPPSADESTNRNISSTAKLDANASSNVSLHVIFCLFRKKMVISGDAFGDCILEGLIIKLYNLM
jgi:hypothetical protein